MATKDKSAIVSGMGLGMSIIQSLVEKARRKGVSDEEIHRLATPEGDAMLEQFAEIMASTRNAAVGNLCSVTVDYGMSFADMIAVGRYDWMNSNITAENFPVKGEGKAEVEVQLVHFDRMMESDEVIRELDKMGLRPGIIEELLAFGAKSPDVQRESPVVALKPVWRSRLGDRFVADLGRYYRERILDLDIFEGRWSEFYRFLAARK